MDNYCSSADCNNPHLHRKLSRSKMPQFTRSSRIKLDKTMRTSGYKLKYAVCSPKRMYPSQHEISKSGAERLLEKWGTRIKLNARKNPILLAKDRSIIDGHHRWLALMTAIERGLLPMSYKAPVYMYTAPVKRALALATTIATPRHHF